MLHLLPCILLTLVVLFPAQLWASDETYCDEVANWQDWEERITKSPNDIALQTLHALWMGLCVKVQRHELSVDKADDIFEQVRRGLVRKHQERNATIPTPPL